MRSLCLYLIALLQMDIVSVRVGEVDMAACFLHDLLNVAAPFPDHMGVLSVGHVHLQSHLVNLETHKTPA